MKTKKFKLIAALFISAFVCISSSSSVLAQAKIKKIENKAVTEVRAQPMKLPCDVSISYIEYFDCPCDLDMDVFYVDERIAVKLFNESTLSPSVKLTVKYFDVRSNRERTIVRNVTFAGRSSKKVTVMNNPLLIKKSYGVKPELEGPIANMADPDLSNTKPKQFFSGQGPEKTINNQQQKSGAEQLLFFVQQERGAC